MLISGQAGIFPKVGGFKTFIWGLLFGWLESKSADAVDVLEVILVEPAFFLWCNGGELLANCCVTFMTFCKIKHS